MFLYGTRYPKPKTRNGPGTGSRARNSTKGYNSTGGYCTAPLAHNKNTIDYVKYLVTCLCSAVAYRKHLDSKQNKKKEKPCCTDDSSNLLS